MPPEPPSPSLTFFRAAVRLRFGLLALWVAVVAGAIWHLPRLEFEFSLHPLLRGGDAKVEAVRDFYRTFPPAEGHAIVTASWPEVVTVNQLRKAARWAEALEDLPEVSRVYSPAALLDLEFQGFTLDEWARLGGDGDEPVELGEGEGMGTIRGRFLSEDLKSAAFHVRKSRGTGHERLIETLRGESVGWVGVETKVLGTAVVLEEMVRNVRADLVHLLMVDIVVLLVILPFFFRSLRRAYLPLAVAATGLLVFFAVLVIADRPIGLIYLAAPVLIVVIGLSDAIHLLQRFDAARALGASVPGALRSMMRSVGAACVLTSVTTAIGFLSLGFARHEEIREFGMWCAIGVAIAFVVAIVFLPVALALWPGRRPAEGAGGGHLPLAAGWRRRLALPVTLVLVATSVGAAFVQVDTALSQELPAGAPVVRDIKWFAQHFHGADRVEVEVRGPLDDPAVFAAVEGLQGALAEVKGVKGSSSYADVIRFMMPAHVVETKDGPYLGLRAMGTLGDFPENLLTRDGDRACVVFYTSDAFGSHQYREFERRFETLRRTFPEGASAEITGYVPMAYESVNLITDTLIRSFMVSLGAITLVLALALRSPGLALLCLVPNALPILAAAGVLGWFDIPLRIGVVIVFCVGLGLAVDDTIHLIVRYRQLGRERPRASVRENVDEAVRSSGFAIVLTSVVLLVASVAFLFSDFSTMRDTGLLLGVITVAAVLSDLFLFPWLIELSSGRVRRGAAAAGAAAGAGVALVVLFPVPLRGEVPTFSEHIAPLVQDRCVECHRRGEAAPFPLESYRDVRRRARLVRDVVDEGFMPPWHAVGGDVPLAGDRRLTVDERDLVVRWIDAGAPEGDPAHLPPARQFPGGWELGEPDLVLEMPEAYEVAAEGADIYRNFVIPTGLGEDRWLKAVAFEASSPKVVHHSLFYLDSTGAARRADEAEPGPGFSEMPFGVGLGPLLGGWVPGARALPLPDGMAHEIPAGSDLVLATHFHPSGKPEPERSRVGLYFGDAPPTRPFMAIQLPPVFGAFAGIDLSPGDPAGTVTDRFTLPVAVEAFGATAHAHYLGRSLRLVAELPDGGRTVLLNVPHWDIAWQEEYRFARPARLPAGTRLVSTVVWDNSEANPANPNVPPVRVRWGRESADEMGSLTLMVSTETDDAMRRLRREYRQHLAWQAGSHVLGDTKIAFAGDLREQAMERFDLDGDGELGPAEKEAARGALRAPVISEK